MRVRPLAAADATACDTIVAGLPAWFGDPTGIAACAAAVRAEPGFAATLDDRVIGFLTVTQPREHAAEISWMAVDAAHRGHGAGRALVEALVADLQRSGARYLAVKTLSDRDDDPGYAATRAFYLAMGFTPLMDLDVWGPDNPALLLVRSVSMPRDAEGLPAAGAEDLAVAARVGAERLTPAVAVSELGAGAILVDQRTLEQRREHGDIPGATRMSMTVVPWRLDPQSPWKEPAVIDHDTRIIVVCQEGYSSSLSAAWLRELGMRRVADVEGGFDAWRDTGLPVVPLDEG